MAERVPARLSPEAERAGARKFGYTVGPAFLVFAGIAFWRGHPVTSQVLAGLGGVLLVLGLVVPAVLVPVEKAWMKFALLLSKVTTPIFMGVVYFAVLTPTGILRRTFGQKLMSPSRRSDTYWVPVTKSGPMTRQF